MKRTVLVFIALLAGCANGSSSLGQPEGSVEAIDAGHRRHPSPTPAPSAIPSAAPTGLRSLPNPLGGVTVDDISNSAGVVSSLKLLTKPVTRIVFDKQEPASYYLPAIEQFDNVGYTMGEILDSSDMSSVSVSALASRTASYLSALTTRVDIWEIGNEVNGEWLGASVPAKIQNTFTAVHASGYQTEMTLYYEPSQTVTPGYDMIPWEENLSNVPSNMHAGLNYVLVSYYETDNNNIRPTQADWDVIFRKLAIDFPNAKLGFGEVGMDNPATSGTLAKAENIMAYYYGLKFPDVPQFVGGDFWWYFAEDCVPTTTPLLAELEKYI